MTQAIGASARITYVPETTWGTTPGSPSMRQLKAIVGGESLGAEIERLMSMAINASRSVESYRGGRISVKGAMPFEVAPLGFATLMKHALGTVATTGTATYTHTIKRAALPAGMTIEKGFTDLAKYFVFTGCKPDKVSINVTPRGIVTGSMDIIGKQLSYGTTSLGTATTAAHSPFVQHEAVNQEGGSNATLLNLALSWTNALDPVEAIGSRYIQALTEGKGMCEGSITMMFEDTTTLDKWLNETSSSLKCTFTSSSQSLEFYMGAVKYFGDAVPKIQNDKGVIVELPFAAAYDSSSATDLRVTFVNSESSI